MVGRVDLWTVMRCAPFGAIGLGVVIIGPKVSTSTYLFGYLLGSGDSFLVNLAPTRTPQVYFGLRGSLLSWIPLLAPIEKIPWRYIPNDRIAGTFAPRAVCFSIRLLRPTDSANHLYITSILILSAICCWTRTGASYGLVQ